MPPQKGRETGVAYTLRRGLHTEPLPLHQSSVTSAQTDTFNKKLLFTNISPRELSQPQFSANCVHVKGSVFMLAYLCCLIDSDKLKMIPWSRWNMPVYSRLWSQPVIARLMRFSLMHSSWHRGNTEEMEGLITENLKSIMRCRGKSFTQAAPLVFRLQLYDFIWSQTVPLKYDGTRSWAK